MRSSKSRSRGKSRGGSRSPANNINRVFDSSGPEGKVRGTPQQIIDKYGQLARDAFLAGDRVAGENFQQHAEHYARMLAEAQRDAEEKRQQADQQNRERQQQKQRERDEREAARRDAKSDQGAGDQPDVIEVEEGDAGLVETPEEKPKKPSRARKPKTPKPAADAKPEGGDSSPEAAE